MIAGIALACIFVGSILQFLGDRWGDRTDDEKLKKRFDRMGLWGFALTMLAVPVNGCEQITAGWEADVAQSRIEAKADENIGLSKKNTELAESLADAQKEMKNLLTGADSLFYLDFVDKEDGPTKPRLRVLGKHDIPEVDIEIIDLGRMRDADSATRFKIGRVAVDSEQMLLRFPSVEKGKINSFLIVIVQSGRSTAYQFVRVAHFESGKHCYASRVYRHVRTENKVRYISLLPELSKTDECMPVDENGKVEAVDFPEAVGLMKLVE